MRGLVIAGTHSGCGKTTVTLGLLAALKEKGLKVQSFKAGPDFIDSGLHRVITGRPSRNLDLWMCGEEYVRDCYFRNAEDVDIAVVEGVMGLYDGTLSTSSLAARLGIPVILVIDAYGMAETARAIVKGMIDFRPPLSPLLAKEGMGEVKSPLNFAGVIFNRVASENHFKRLRESVTDMPVLGYLPRDLNFEIPHRHLGLTVAEDNPLAEKNIGRLADAVLKHIDIDELLKATEPLSYYENAGNNDVKFPLRKGGVGGCAGQDKEQPPLSPFINGESKLKNCCSIKLSAYREGIYTSDDNKIKIAVAYDRAFCFYYEDNLELLRNEGAGIIQFSPLTDASLPEGTDVIYIGGGYPELHAEALSMNKPMLHAINVWAASGRPLYAECGGLMYLSKGIYDFEGNFFSMANVFPFETRMKKGRSNLGYRQVLLKEDCIIGKQGWELRGHEFHYSEITGNVDGDYAIQQIYLRKNGSGEGLPDEGFWHKKTLASYIHLHFGSNPGIAREFINSCKDER